jgi:hypothetical protein
VQTRVRSRGSKCVRLDQLYPAFLPLVLPRFYTDRLRPRRPERVPVDQIPPPTSRLRRRTNASARTRFFPSAPLARLLAPSPCPPSRPHGRLENKIKNFILFCLGSCCPLEKKGKKCSVFNPQDPRDPRAPRASQAKPQEEEGFFGLVP